MGADVGVKKGPRSDINITPLVDIVLVLLIIFMVLTPLMEKEIGVRVPEEPDPTQIVPPPDPDLLQIVFKVDDAGNFHINSETVPESSLGDRLKAYYKMAKSKEATQGPPVIFFDADDKAKYVRAVKALDAIRDSSPGWTIGMMTESLKQPPAGTPEGGGAPPPGGEAPAPAPAPTPAPQ